MSVKVLERGEAIAKTYGAGRLDALLGDVPFWLSLSDRPAKEIFQTHYVGGWHPSPGVNYGFKILSDGTLRYPGDPDMKPLIRIKHGDEVVYQYEHSWVAIVQPDGTFEVDRMD